MYNPSTFVIDDKPSSHLKDSINDPYKRKQESNEFKNRKHCF